MERLNLILLLSIVVLLAGCSRSQNSSDEGVQTGEEPVEERRVVVSAETARMGTFVVYGEYIGEARGISEVKLTVDTDGQVAKVFASDGDIVRAGQSLAEIDPEKASKRYQAAILNERLARETYEREQRFLNEGNSFQLKVDQAHLAWLQSQSNLLGAKEERDSSFAITPIAGTVLLRHIYPHDNLESGDPTFDIADLSRIRIIVAVPEADIVGVRELKEAEVVFSTFPDRVFVGTPTGFARGRSQNSLSYQVTVVVDNPNGEILSGQTARVRLVLRRFSDTISVPSRAVLIRSEGSYVFVVRDGIAHEVLVETGATSDIRTVIESGLFADDMVVTEGFNRLADGELVEIHN